MGLFRVLQGVANLGRRPGSRINSFKGEKNMAIGIGFFTDTNANANSSFLDRNIKALHQAYESTGRQPEEKQKASAGLLSAASEKVLFLSKQRNISEMSSALARSMNGSDLAISIPRGPGQ